MARFVVLKAGSNYNIFDFNGNIARVGPGSEVDLRLEAAAAEGDFFFLVKTADAYQLEVRNPEVGILVNGNPVKDRISLSEGSKIQLFDYLILVTYKSDGDQVAEAEPSRQPEAAVAEAPKPEPAPMPSPAPSADIPTAPSLATPAEQMPQSEKPAAPPTPAAPADQPTAPRIPAGQAPAQPAAPRPDTPTAPGLDNDKTEQITIPPEEELPPAPPPKQRPRLEAVYCLVCLSGQHKGKTIPIDAPEFVVGRDLDCNLRVSKNERGQEDRSVSRQHFTITTQDDVLYISDRVSRLRTYVNGNVIEKGEREQITPEDIISIPAAGGEVKFRLCLTDDPNPYPDTHGGIPWKWIILLVSAIIVLIIVLMQLLKD